MAARRHHGFTLVELLVALFVLALLAVLSWRGLDGMARAQEQTRTRADQVQALQVGLSQWNADLDALIPQLPQTTTLDWNGRVVRMIRRSSTSGADGVLVVGWARRVDGGVSRWMRWQSPPLTTRGAVEQAWQQADAWAGNVGVQAGANQVAVTGLDDWQVFFYRNDAWTNPLSSDTTQAGTTATPAASAASAAGSGSGNAGGSTAAGGTGSGAGQTSSAGGTRSAVMPDGVRIVLMLSAGQALSGEFVRDWVRSTLGGNKA